MREACFLFLAVVCIVFVVLCLANPCSRIREIFLLLGDIVLDPQSALRKRMADKDMVGGLAENEWDTDPNEMVRLLFLNSLIGKGVEWGRAPGFRARGNRSSVRRERSLLSK